MLGFAGWTFLLAKTTSAATAALGLSDYLLDPRGVQTRARRVSLAVSIAIAVTAFVPGGIRRSNRGDAPRFLSRVDAVNASPVASVWAWGAAVAALALIGDVRTAWSFSAFFGVGL